MLHEFNEPFVFPSQVQHVFFSSEPKMPLWKVVFHKKPRSCKVAANTFNDCIDTHDVMYGLEPPLEFLDMKSNRTLVGAIKLNRGKRLLAAQVLHGSLGIDDVV